MNISTPSHDVEWQLLFLNSKIAMRIMATEGREGERAAASKITDWSVGTKMKDEVARWDKIKRLWEEGRLDLKEWDHILTRGRPSRIKFAKACAKINPNTFQRYTHNDICKRTELGTKLGRKKSASTDHTKREEKLIKKARENKHLQMEANKIWEHRSMYQ